jgi:hypothetical protein
MLHFGPTICAAPDPLINLPLLLLLQGAEVHFAVVLTEGSGLGLDTQLSVYTTRPDTLFGATYMVVAPEHPLLSQVRSCGVLVFRFSGLLNTSFTKPVYQTRATGPPTKEPNKAHGVQQARDTDLNVHGGGARAPAAVTGEVSESDLTLCGLWCWQAQLLLLQCLTMSDCAVCLNRALLLAARRL